MRITSRGSRNFFHRESNEQATIVFHRIDPSCLGDSELAHLRMQAEDEIVARPGHGRPFPGGETVDVRSGAAINELDGKHRVKREIKVAFIVIIALRKLVEHAKVSPPNSGSKELAG
jgi:hypothetical protein